MTRITTILTASLFFGILFLLTPATSSGQRRGGGRGSGVGVSTGSGIGAASGSGVGAIGAPSRRTAVVAAAAANGEIGDGKIGDGRYGGRSGYAGNIARPGLAAVAVARRVPIGTVVAILPADCQMAFILEMEYYYCSGQYYQPMGTATDPMYVAAEPYIPDAYIPDPYIP